MSYLKFLDAHIEQSFALIYILAFISHQDWIEEKALVAQFAKLSVKKPQAISLISSLHKQKLLKSLAQKTSFFKYQYLYHISTEGQELLTYYLNKYHHPLSAMLVLPQDSPHLKS